MPTPKRFHIGASVFFVLWIFTSAATAQKKIPLSTHSQAARQNYVKGLAALNSFDNPRAREFAQKAVQADGNFALARLLLAEVSPRSERQSMLASLPALAKNASAGEQAFVQGMVHVLKNETDAALPVFTRLAKEYPGDHNVALRLGQLYLAKGQYRPAIAALKKAMEIDGSTPRAYTLTAQAYLMLDDYQKAQQFYEKAVSRVDRDATPFQPFFGLVWAHVYQGDADGALATLKEFLDRYNRNGAAQGFPPVWIWNQRARINLEFGRAQEALRCYETGYKSVPPSQLDSTQKQIWYGRMLHGKARSLAKMGKYQQAWQIAEGIKQMLEQAGDRGKRFWPSYHYLAGYIKLESGDYAAAAQHLEQANPNDAFHKLLLARAYLKLGKKDQALKLYKQLTHFTRNNVERALSYPEARKMVSMLSSN